MSIKTYKALAMLCLLLAIAAVAGAFWASQRRVAIQGPSAVAPLPDGTVWLAVEDALWRFDAQGRRVAVVPAAAHGMQRAIGALARHPDGRLVAWSRGDAQLYFLDPQTGARRGGLLPQWPADLREHGDRAIHYAFHPDGRVAIATGGGHAVAVFGADGRFLGRTAPGTYVFTNGLWWQGDSLWTTDTNRFALVELDGATLAQKSRVKLQGPLARCRFLGMAAPIEDRPPAAGEGMTLVRFANNMLEGELVDVLPDGGQRPWRADARLEPRDLKWHGRELLLVDGASYAVKRFAANREALGDFGDAATQDSLARALRERAALGKAYHAGLAAAVLLFLAGLALAWRAGVLEKGARLRQLDVDLSQLGTPLLDAGTRLRLAGRLAWPLLVLGAGLVAFRFMPSGWLAWTGLAPRIAAQLGLIVLLLLGLAAVLWRMRTASRDRALDTLMNQAAVLALVHKPVFWDQREPGELPRETLMLSQAMGGRHWLVLTNRRLLVFVSNLSDHSLKSEHARHEIAGAAVLDAGAMDWRQRLLAALSGACWLRLELRDGTRLEGLTLTRLTAQRFADLLRVRAPAAAQPRAARPRMPALAPGQVPDESRAVWQTLASLLVPGLGQWMQRRSGTAFFMFLMWALVLLAAAVPVAWTLWAPRAEVSARTLGYTLAVYLTVCVIAATDAWRMRARAA